MNEVINIKCNNTNIKISVLDKKYISYFDDEKKNLIIRTIDNYFQKLGDSEYAQENGYTNEVDIDLDRIRIADFLYFNVNSAYNLNTEVKVSTKNIFSKYLECILDKIEYSEQYQTLTIVFSDLLDSLSDEISSDFSGKNPILTSVFEKKQLMKMIEPRVVADSLEINDYDITLKEKVIFQLEMIKRIVNSSNKRSLVIVDVYAYEKEFEDIINQFSKNALVIIFFNKIDIEIEKEDDLMIITKNDVIDLYDDNKIYDLCQSYHKDVDIHEMKEILVEKVMKLSKF